MHQINNPGFYQYKIGKRVNDIIRESGGLKKDANKEEIYIIFANGKSKKYRRYISNPIVKDGSIIHVNKKKDEEPFDATEYYKEITTIVANLAQAVSLLLIANR